MGIPKMDDTDYDFYYPKVTEKPYYGYYETTRRPYYRYYETTRRAEWEDYDYGYKEEIKELEHLAEEALAPVAETLHVAPWMLVAGVLICILVLIVIISLIVWKIVKKKRLSSGAGAAKDDGNEIEKQEIAETEQ